MRVLPGQLIFRNNAPKFRNALFTRNNHIRRNIWGFAIFVCSRWHVINPQPPVFPKEYAHVPTANNDADYSRGINRNARLYRRKTAACFPGACQKVFIGKVVGVHFDRVICDAPFGEVCGAFSGGNISSCNPAG